MTRSCAIIHHRDAARYLERLTAKERDRIMSAIESFAIEPRPGHLDVKKMKDATSYRLRVGRYRILMSRRIEDSMLLVLGVGPRGDVYKA